MKQTIIAIALLLATGSTSPMMAQSHRHTPRASVQIDAHKNGNSTTATIKVDAPNDQGIDAYSDTTDVDSAAAYSSADYDEDEDFSVNGQANDFDFIKDITHEFFFPIIIIAIIFVTPVLIIGLICYYLYKSRKQKIRLAELAIEKGQPIPDGVINEPKPENTAKQAEPKDEEQAAKGIKYTFFGIGVAILGLCIDASVIIGAGLLLACMGAGQFATSYLFKKKEQKKLEWRQ